MMTPQTAPSYLCAFARTFRAPQPDGGCHGPSCALWRWVPVTTSHPAYKDALRAKAAELDEKPPYAKAARFVADNMADLGLVVTHGYCGAGGPV
ncbi:MAG: hypothetical protein ACRC14_07720 [Paracoccaceae bacterium]